MTRYKCLPTVSIPCYLARIEPTISRWFYLEALFNQTHCIMCPAEKFLEPYVSINQWDTTHCYHVWFFLFLKLAHIAISFFFHYWFAYCIYLNTWSVEQVTIAQHMHCYPVLGNEIRTIYPHGLNKVFDLKFCVGS